MNTFDPIIHPAISTLISFAFSKTKWDANADLINEKIDHIVSNFQLLTVENFKYLTPNIQEKLVDKLLESPESSVSSLMDYLGDETCSRLVNQGKHVDKLAHYFLRQCEGETLSLHSTHLMQERIAHYIQSLDPETKRGVREIDLSDCFHLKNLDFMKEAFESLEKVNLSHDDELQNLEGLKGKARLSEVELGSCFSLRSIEPLDGLPIERLNVSECSQLTTIKATISSLSNLAFIDLSACLGIDIEDWKRIEWPSSLQEANVAHVPRFREEALNRILSKNPDLKINLSDSGASQLPKRSNASNPETYIRV